MRIFFLLWTLSDCLLANYKFWKGIGQIFYDYSSNYQYAINGDSTVTTEFDTLCTDRGIYINSDSFIQFPPNSIMPGSINLLSSSISIYIYPLILGNLITRSNKYSDISLSISLTPYIFEVIESPNNEIIINIPLTNLSYWSLVTLEIANNEIKIYIQNVLLFHYHYSFNIDSLLLQSTLFTLGKNMTGFIYEIWIDNASTSIDNYIVKAGTNDCISGICFFGHNHACKCDFCIISPNVSCIAKVNNPYLSSNGMLCNESSLSSDIYGNCRECTNCVENFCLSTYTCMKFCYPPCSECKSYNYCTACIDSLAIARDGKCTCPPGYYLDQYLCRPCNSNCTLCESQDYCTKCKDPNAHLISYKSGYVCACNFGMYFNGEICTDCSSICVGCIYNQFNCIMCADLNSQKIENGCQCKPGFYQEEECVPCNDACATCNDFDYCTSCINGFELVNNECINEIIVINDTICELGYFTIGDQCKKCKPPCDLCIESELDCVNCIKNAIMVANYSCECIKHYAFINDTCLLTLELDIKTSSNLIYLQFSNNLSEPLSNISLQLYSNDSFSWNLDPVNEILSIWCRIDINDMIIIIEFFDGIKDIEGGILFNTSYEIILPVCKSNYTNINNNSVTSIGYILGALTIVSSLLGMNNLGPSLIWTLIGTMQLLSYLSMININYPPLLSQYFVSLNYFLIPNFFTYFWVGIPQTSFFFTTGRDLSIMVFMLLLYYFLKILTTILKGKVLNLVRKLLLNFKWNCAIRIWIFCYAELVNGSLSQILYLDYSSGIPFASSFFGIFFFILVLITPFISYIFIITNYYRITQSVFLTKYSSLVYEFTLEDPNSVLYYYFYFVRRLLYLTSLTILYPFPFIQCGINILLSLSFLCILLKFKFFKKSTQRGYNIICELSILASTILSSAFLMDLQDTISQVILYSCISIGGITTFINLALTFYEFIKGMKKYKRDKLRHGPTIAAHKNLPSLAGLHISSASARENSLES